MAHSKASDVLMFGWEYPPFNSGGLGTACHGLSNALVEQNINVTFVLPRKVKASSQKVNLVFADNHEVDIEYYRKMYSAYIDAELFKRYQMQLLFEDAVLSSDLVTEVYRYMGKARSIAKKHHHNVIHAHDWLAFGAGLEAREESDKPLVLHVHATELDRTGFQGVNEHIYDIEKTSLKQADRIVAVSGYTRNILVKHYGISADKVVVIHNGINHHEYKPEYELAEKLKKIFGKIILFVGRLTLQKGPDYFVKAAAEVLKHNNNVTFIIAGSGDAEDRIVRDAAEAGIANHVYFPGFLRDNELNALYQAATMYVMSSVSEPFGIAALESIANGTPVILAHQSGVGEVLLHSLKVNFWDTHEMANKILSVLEYDSLYQTLRLNSQQEIQKFSWHESAKQCIHIYNNLL